MKKQFYIKGLILTALAVTTYFLIVKRESGKQDPRVAHFRKMLDSLKY